MSSKRKEKETVAGMDLPLRRSARTQTNNERDGSEARPIVITDSPQSKSGYSDNGTTASKQNENIPLVTALSSVLPSQLQGLSKKGVQLLCSKQERLKDPKSQIKDLPAFSYRSGPTSSGFSALKDAVHATLVFAQEEAGTAVCISKTGLLLTCSHCVAESPEELDLDQIWWLLFASGQAVQAKTVKWDPRRDLALLQIVAAQSHTSADSFDLSNLSCRPKQTSGPVPHFPITQLASKTPTVRTPLLCIGHPGSEDLEIGRPGVATGYDVLHISEGKFRGYAKGQDIQDNSEIGALMHDCWTYWGHSGAPLLDVKSGALIGLHSSWDDETAMRRGVGWEALRDFLGEYTTETNVCSQ